MPLEDNVYFEQCMDFLASMIEKYGSNINMIEKNTEVKEHEIATTADKMNVA